MTYVRVATPTALTVTSHNTSDDGGLVLRASFDWRVKNESAGPGRRAPGGLGQPAQIQRRAAAASRAQAPATCRVAALRRFHTLIPAIAISSAASARSS
jgi:hypothetical protein